MMHGQKNIKLYRGSCEVWH